MLNGFGDVEGAKAEVAALGVQVGYHGADMSKPADIEAMMAAAAEQFGRIGHPGEQRRYPVRGPHRAVSG